MGKENWTWDAGSESWPASCSAAYRKVRTRLYHPRETRLRDLVQLLALVCFFVSSSLSTGFSIKAGCWWLPDVALAAVVWPAVPVCSLPLYWRANTNLGVLQFCCSWTQLFLSLPPWALPAALSRSVGQGAVALFPPLPLLIGCQLPKVSYCLFDFGRELASQNTLFPQELLHFVVSHQHATLSSLSRW